MALRLDIIGLRLDDSGGKSLVIQRAVIAFRIILNRHLPVASFRDFHPFQRAKPFDLGHMRRQFGAHTREPVIHRPCIRVEIDEQEATEILDRHLCQADVLAAKPLDGFDVGPGPQLPAKIIAPGVIGAGQDSGAAMSRDKLVGAVLADIVERIDRAIAVHHTEQGFPRHLEGEVIARVLQLRGVSGKLPAGRKQSPRFNFENRRVGVVPRLQ